jgi:hypothetical protein
MQSNMGITKNAPPPWIPLSLQYASSPFVVSLSNHERAPEELQPLREAQRNRRKRPERRIQ